MKTKISLFIVITVLIYSIGLNTSYCQCGPGPHWIDECYGAVDDIMESGALVGVNFNLANCNLPLEVGITLSGNVTAHRMGSHDIQVTDGICPAAVDGHYDVIPTEIISMNLTSTDGYTLIVGPALAPELQHSFGYVVEKPEDNTLGCSFFDVWFKVIAPDGTLLYNQTSLRLEATISQVPPSVTYFHPVGMCIGLYTSPVPAEGVLVANLVQAQHTVSPYFQIPTLSQWGLIILGMLLLTTGMVFVYKRHAA